MKTLPEQKWSAAFLSVGILVVGLIGYLQYGGLYAPDKEDADFETVWFSSIEDFNLFFSDHHYSVEKWRRGEQSVPRLILTDIPKLWREKIAPSLSVEEKKRVFFRVAIPLVLVANEELAIQRAVLMELQSKANLSDDATKWLLKKSEEYKLPTVNDPRLMIADLAARIDGIPASIAIAQMAVESGWGTSRFAVEGNALFGQWSYGSGLKPLNQRTEKGDYRIRVFESPLASVRGYMRNLNSNKAYKTFRDTRAEMRRSGRPLSGDPLLHTLSKYSEQGELYIQSLRSIIMKNNIAPFDDVLLSKEDTYYFSPVIELVTAITG